MTECLLNTKVVMYKLSELRSKEVTMQLDKWTVLVAIEVKIASVNDESITQDAFTDE